MKIKFTAILAATVFASVLSAKDTDSVKRLDAASDLLSSMMKADDKGVPQDLINKAQCVILIPGLKKAAFIVGGKYGKGFASCRKMSGTGWSAPAAIRVEGGSVGFQIGGSEQDVLLLVMNETGMKHLLESKFTLGAEAAAAAGPVGRNLSAQTDVQLRAEMLSYSRARGLFAGLSLGGATLRPDDETNTEMYGHEITNKEILTTAVKAPASAAKLGTLLNRNSVRKAN